MLHIIPPWPLLAAFCTASLILAVTPGPGVLYILTRSFAQGRRLGLVSVAGVALGNWGNAIAAAIGLGTLLALSSTAFLVIKYAGALYLIYLGIQAFRAPPTPATATPRLVNRSARRLFWDGALVSMLNPKTTLFFATFLPQFMAVDASPLLQSLFLGSLFVAIAAFTDSGYALFAGSATPLLAQTQRLQTGGRYLVGSLFIGQGLFTAFADTRSEQ
ncbi:LysE family translocator [Leptolyngbya sp. PCC 6406]|uniref:LysE family translocator n=1 Tax=Leptolyngbya sp. PCC 6406 TaxID=1173264 RepID=UPI0002AC42A3|nr:LysE family translocator [Leptolyngbya sp. PCC 6406]